MTPSNTRMSFGKRNLDSNQNLQQVYGIEFKYNDQPIAIKNFALGCFYHLLRSAVWIFNDPNIDAYEYCNQFDEQDLSLLTQVNQLASQTETINDRWFFYNLESVIGHSQAIKTHLDTFGSAKHFYQNPVADTTQLANWANQFVQPYIFNPLSVELQIANSIDCIAQSPNSNEILSRIYQTVNLVTNKIYAASQQILVVPDPAIDVNQIQINIVVKKVQYCTVGSYSIDNISPDQWDRIRVLINHDIDLNKFLQNASSSFNHFYKLNSLREHEFLAIKTQLMVSLNESDFHITKYYLAATTDDCRLVLQLLIPGKFECWDNIWSFFRTCIQ